MERTDRGFTLVELLIVIVVLGVLSSVSVFAVRGITSRGEAEGCSADLDVLVKAQESHAVLFGTYADSPTLVAAGLLGSESVRYDVAGDADGYTLTPAADSACTDTAGSSTAAPPPAPAPTSGPTSAGATLPARSTSYDGIEAWHWWTDIDDDPNDRPPDEIVVFGRGEAAGQFIALVAADPATTRRVTLLDLDDVSDSGDIDDAINRARGSGTTTWVLYTGDDTSNLTDTNDSVDAYLSTVWNQASGFDHPPHPNDSYVNLGPGDDLLTLVP
ncbi:MAG: prepilin-type N-terminal cleavage/methylation domain-containing protein [Actinomycetota bacterium]